jgi:hypothetical protein
LLLAHRELRVGLSPLGSLFVIVVVLIFPLIAAGLVWTAAKRLGLILLLLSIFGSLLFGLYHHFLAISPGSRPFAASQSVGNDICPDRVSIARYRSDWNLRRNPFSEDREQSW